MENVGATTSNTTHGADAASSDTKSNTTDIPQTGEIVGGSVKPDVDHTKYDENTNPSNDQTVVNGIAHGTNDTLSIETPATNGVPHTEDHTPLHAEANMNGDERPEIAVHSSSETPSNGIPHPETTIHSGNATFSNGIPHPETITLSNVETKIDAITKPEVVAPSNAGENMSDFVPIVNDISNEQVRPLDVLIVGGGLGGLAAAIALRRQGHNVQVFEQSRLMTEIGAAVHMGPNATGSLKHLGVDPKDTGAVELRLMRFFNPKNNKLMFTRELWKDAGRWQHSWRIAHRAHLHTQLKDAAISDEGEGRPATLNVSSRVMKVDPDTATIYFEDGTEKTGDIVIGADGIHSQTRKALGDNVSQAVQGKRNAYRFLLEREAVLADPETAQFGLTDSSQDMWNGPDRTVVLYPTTHNKILNFIAMHSVDLSEATTGGYNISASKENFLEIYKDFDPSVVKLLNKVDPDSLKVYNVMEMDVLPSFVRGKLVVLGDAAHPFTPHLGLGGGQAIEDAVSLGVFLGKGVTPEEIPERLQLYNVTRHQRPTILQDVSRIVAGDSPKNSDIAKLPQNKIREMGPSHDEFHHSTQILREHLWKKNQPRWRIPTVFGPMPGPQQDAGGSSHVMKQQGSRTTKATIKFKTSGTLLRNLFPNKSYSFGSGNTLVTAGFEIQSLHNLGWLSGGGYNRLVFQMYDVQLSMADGKSVNGAYSPIVFVDLADAVLSEREELGLPTMFADINIHRTAESFGAKLSWRGVEWADFNWSSLQQNTGSLSKQADEGLLVHNYVPVNSGNGQEKLCVEYDCLISDNIQAASVTSAKVSPAGSARFDIKDPGVRKLPTLHHIVSRLAELPVFEIVEATVVEYDGDSSQSTSKRLN